MIQYLDLPGYFVSEKNAVAVRKIVAHLDSQRIIAEELRNAKIEAAKEIEGADSSGELRARDGSEGVFAERADGTVGLDIERRINAAMVRMRAMREELRFGERMIVWPEYA